LPGETPTEIRTEGARNFLARKGAAFDLIEVSEISSATYSSLGIHATGETYLLTREGIRSALSRLAEKGVIVFSGWLKAPPRESAKILRTLRPELEGDDPVPASRKVVMVRGWGTFAIIARRLPFTEEEIKLVDRFCGETGFSIVWPPDGAPAGNGPGEMGLLTAVRNALAGPPGTAGEELFDLSPTTDDSPYFHRFLRLRSLPEFRAILGSQWVPFVEWGVVFLLASLAVSLALASVCLLFPLAVAPLPGKTGGIYMAGYFSALGLAYMLIELTFLKIGILILGDAIRAASVAIGGFAFFSGLGSAVSGRWESEAGMEWRVFPGIAFLAMAGFLFQSQYARFLLQMGEMTRIVVFLASLGPAAFLMGMPFPSGLSRLAGDASPAIPYAWGINGFFSVAGASMASVGAMWIGFRGTIVIGGILYLAAGWLFPRVGKTPGY
jgi:hypothetical protein